VTCEANFRHLLLLGRCLSAKSASVCHYVKLISSMIYERGFTFSHLTYFTVTTIFVFD
jgi:hypothetical protein